MPLPLLPREIVLTAPLKQPARSAIQMLIVCPSLHSDVPNVAAEFEKAHKDDTTILVADLDKHNNWCVDSWNLAGAKSERLAVKITPSKTDSDSSNLFWSVRITSSKTHSGNSNLVWAYDNGLLCVYGPDSGYLFLCNPASGQSKVLPPPPFLWYRGLADYPTVFYLSVAPVASMASNYHILAVSVTTTAFGVYYNKSSDYKGMDYYLLTNQKKPETKKRKRDLLALTNQKEPEWIKITAKGLPRHIPQEGSVCIGSALYFTAYTCPEYGLMKLDLVAKSFGSIIELPEELSTPDFDSTYMLINHMGKVGLALRNVKGSTFKLWVLCEAGDWMHMRISTDIFNHQDPLVPYQTVSFEGCISDGILVFNVAWNQFFTKPTEEAVFYYNLQNCTYRKYLLKFQRSSSSFIIWNHRQTIQML